MLATALRGLVIGLTALAFAAPAHAEMSVLDNDQLRVGVDLEQGGALTWLSRSRGEHVPNLLSVAEQSY
jgi:hypothetical protein